jgi:AraC-like DNA-binding protein
MKHRHCAVVIVTRSGRIRFTQGERSFVSDSTHPVFIPEGASYVNECIEDAESLMFSFLTVHSYDEITVLSPLPISECSWYFDTIKNAEISKKNGYKQKQLAAMYSMLEGMFSTPEQADRIAVRAALLIRKRYADCGFTCKALASALFVSEAYLRREFKKEHHTGVGEYLRRIRMEKARELLLERRSVSESALECGYSDVYQFSRAYKRYYGYSPRETTSV